MTGDGVTKANPPPSLTIPSPKSPKVNPFSNPSPVQNPFMSIVDGKNDPYMSIVDSSSSSSSTSAAESKTRGGFERNIPEAVSIIDKPENAQLPKSEEKETCDAKVVSTDADSTKAYGKVYHLQENAVVVTGEEGEECVLQMRAKLFRLSATAEPSTAAAVSTDRLSPTSAEPTQGADGSQSTTATSSSEGAVSAATPAGEESSPSAADSSSSLTVSDEATPKWVEVGVGPVKILRSTPLGAASQRLVMRRESKLHGVGGYRCL